MKIRSLRSLSSADVLDALRWFGLYVFLPVLVFAAILTVVLFFLVVLAS